MSLAVRSIPKASGEGSMTRQKQVLTTGEVARICNVAPRTVSKWFDSGQLRGYRIPGSKDRRIPLDQLVRFMKSHDMPLNGLTRGRQRVLLVMASREMREAVGLALTQRGTYDVEMTGSAFEAGLLAASFLPDVLVVDAALPQIDPENLRRQVRSHDGLQDTKLIAVVGAGDIGRGHALVQQGFTAFLQSPFQARELILLIELGDESLPVAGEPESSSQDGRAITATRVPVAAAPTAL